MLEGNKTLENLHAPIFHRSTTMVDYVTVATFSFLSDLHSYLNTMTSLTKEFISVYDVKVPGKWS